MWGSRYWGKYWQYGELAALIYLCCSSCLENFDWCFTLLRAVKNRDIYKDVEPWGGTYRMSGVYSSVRRERKKKKIDVARWRDSSKQKFFKLLKTTSGWSCTNFTTQRHFKVQCAGFTVLFLLAGWFCMFIFWELILLVFHQGQDKGSEFCKTTGYVPTHLVLNVQPKCYFCCVPLALGKLRRPFKSEFQLRQSKELEWPGFLEFNTTALFIIKSIITTVLCDAHALFRCFHTPAMSDIALKCWYWLTVRAATTDYQSSILLLRFCNWELWELKHAVIPVSYDPFR